MAKRKKSKLETKRLTPRQRAIKIRLLDGTAVKLASGSASPSSQHPLAGTSKASENRGVPGLTVEDAMEHILTPIIMGTKNDSDRLKALDMYFTLKGAYAPKTPEKFSLQRIIVDVPRPEWKEEDATPDDPPQLTLKTHLPENPPTAGDPRPPNDVDALDYARMRSGNKDAHRTNQHLGCHPLEENNHANPDDRPYWMKKRG
jgi:hypothetical protein